MRHLLIALALFVTSAHADTWVNVYGLSHHAKSGDREHNPGIGLETSIDRDWSLAVGTYLNSIDRRSYLVAGKYHWIDRGVWKVNVNMGGVTGYRHTEVAPLVLPELCWRWVCGIYIPKFGDEVEAAMAIYLRIPLQ